MQEFIINIMENYGYLGIMILIAIENIFPPIPSEVILTFGGFMTTMTDMTIFGVIISSTIGALLGAYVLYFVGRLVSHTYLKKLLRGRMGKILMLEPKDLENASDWFTNRGKITVFICRFIPLIRSLISIPAGMANMNILTFTFFTFLGTLIWNTVLIYLGAIARNSWKKIVDEFGIMSAILFVIFLVICIAYIYLFYKKRRGEKKKDDKN